MSYGKGHSPRLDRTGRLPFPVHSEGQSVLCALGSSPRLWLSTFNCWVPVPVKTRQQQCILLRVISFRADPVSLRTLTASVPHLFLFLLGSSGSLPWPRDLPFHLVPTPGSRQRGLLFFFFFFSSPHSSFLSVA